MADIAGSVNRNRSRVKKRADRLATDYAFMIEEAAKDSGLPVDLIAEVIRAESGGNPNAVSPAGAKGLMQLMDSTAEGLGVTDPFDARQNIFGGSRYLKQMIERFGGVDKGLAAYNAGPGNVEKYGGIPPFDETEAYVKKIMDSLGLGDAGAGQGPTASTPSAGIPDLSSVIQNMSSMLNYKDSGPMTEEYIAGNKSRLARVQKALGSLKDDQSNIVDKVQPFVEAIGYLADRFSGNRQRRQQAGSDLQASIEGRKARISEREKKKRQEVADFLASEDFAGQIEKGNYDAALKNVQAYNSQQTSKVSAGLQAHGQEISKAQEKRLGEATNVQIQRYNKDIADQKEVDRLLDSITDENNVPHYGRLTPKDLALIRRTNPNMEILTATQYYQQVHTEVTDYYRKIHSKALEEATLDGDMERVAQIEGQIEVLVEAEIARRTGVTPESLSSVAIDDPTGKVNQSIHQSYREQQDKSTWDKAAQAMKGAPGKVTAGRKGADPAAAAAQKLMLESLFRTLTTIPK